MNKPINNGGPAFPQPHRLDGGMSLRDYFAGQAIGCIPLRSWDHMKNDREAIKAWAACAYAVADEMLKHRDALIAAGGEHE